jgi:predicted secreted Zn-dependent protease
MSDSSIYRTVKWVIYLPMMVFFAPFASAEIYQCTIKNQRIYSDQPCEENKTITLKNIPTKTVPLKPVDKQITWNYYSVLGKDYASLIQSLAANGPKGFHGLANWNVTYGYSTALSDGVCRFETVDVYLRGEILMPKWLDQSRASADLQYRWQNYYSALKQHEEGHIQNGMELALLVREKILGLGSFECSQAATLAQRKFDQIYSFHKDRDKKYDERTQHGATQGAKFFAP